MSANKPTGTASSIMDSILKNVPLEWILPVVFSNVLAAIKNPKNERAKAIEKSLISFGQALATKYPGRICPTEEE